MKISRNKLEALAKSGHVRCHGTGINGYRAGAAMICPCVYRALEKKGVNLRSHGALQEAIGAEEKSTEEVANV